MHVFGSGTRSATAKADTKAPTVVKKKLEEAKETVSSHIPKSSHTSTSSTKTTPPAVSATGATEPAPSIEEDRASISSSVSDPGSLSSSSSEAGAAVEDDEDEDPRQAAFNPETGEINWDCPCLGGMAHGVCGEQFREAFSCFVYSKEEPKGQDCIEKFRGMQECFAAHPEVYGEGELARPVFQVLQSCLVADWPAIRQSWATMMRKSSKWPLCPAHPMMGQVTTSCQLLKKP